MVHGDGELSGCCLRQTPASIDLGLGGQLGLLLARSSHPPGEPLRCQVEQFNFSAHATREALRAYANKTRPKKIILVHGDEPAVEWFRGVLSADLPGSEILTPTPGVPLIV